MAIDLRVTPDLAPLVRLGALGFDIGRQLDEDRELDPPLLAAGAAARAGTAADTGPARALYRAIGIDPTKTRPSSEALLRRVRRGEDLPRVNTAVDICNWCSLDVQLPYGLYDRDRIAPPVELRRGAEGEAYAGIRKDVVHLQGRLVLADSSGPFGNPTSDSSRTLVTGGTRRLLLVVFAPHAVDRARMGDVLDMTASRYARWAEARETGRWIS